MLNSSTIAFNSAAPQLNIFTMGAIVDNCIFLIIFGSHTSKYEGIMFPLISPLQVLRNLL